MLALPLTRPPAEQRWFDSLGAGRPVELEWLGKTWLEGQLARVPGDGPLLSGAAGEVVRMLAEISREDALPGDAAGLTRRFVVETGRLNELDPYYRFEFGIAAGTTTVTPHPLSRCSPGLRPCCSMIRLDSGKPARPSPTSSGSGR